jgi:hypothetical protein
MTSLWDRILFCLYALNAVLSAVNGAVFGGGWLFGLASVLWLAVLILTESAR